MEPLLCCRMGVIMNQRMSDELRRGLLDILGNCLVSIILYGSVAKGTETEESDIDIAIILNNKIANEQLDCLLDFIVTLDLKYNKVFSVIDINEKDFDEWQETLPFYKNVKKDGVVLWTVA